MRATISRATRPEPTTAYMRVLNPLRRAMRASERRAARLTASATNASAK
jgi:hypothetical protein